MQSIDYLKKYSCKIFYNHTSLSYFNSGGKIKNLIYPQNVAATLAISKELCKNGNSPLVVGRCTNILIKDKGYNGIMMCLNELKGIYVDGCNLYAAAGESVHAVAMVAKGNCLGGMENIAYIPGTVGGAVAMNAGASGSEMCDIIDYVDVILGGNHIRLTKDEMQFGYRTSICFKQKVIVLGVMLKLHHEKLLLIDSKMKQNLDYRKKTQPTQRSLGSVFKRIDGISPGYYIEQVGLKGTKINGAMISPKHANFIVNTGSAKSSDFEALAKMAMAKVDNAFHISLQYEVLLV